MYPELNASIHKVLARIDQRQRILAGPANSMATILNVAGK